MMRRFLSEEAAPILSSSKVLKATSRFPVLEICAAVGASAAAFSFAFLLFVIIRRACLRRKNSCKIDAEWPLVELRRYKLEELGKATNSFSDERLIGSGAFGNVYKGVFDGGKRTLAVKIAHSDSYETVEEFRNEVELVSRIKHNNLVALVGYCAEAGQRVLLYEYVSHGSLNEYIVGNGKDPLTWNQRVNIAIGSAKGLAHLHEAQPSIIHRDVKPSNILIDKGFEAKVSDFGLVKMGPCGDESHVSTQVKGTPGYMDPAYCSTLHLTPSSDVYSFGVILLQLVTASPVLDHTRHRSKYHISDWAKPSIERGRVEEILDASLQFETCNLKMMLKIAQLGIRCTAWQPKDRPTMTQVVVELEEAQHRATRRVQRSSDAEELDSISIDGVRLQRFSVGSYEDISFKSTSLRCLDVNVSNGGGDRNNLSCISDDMNGR